MEFEFDLENPLLHSYDNFPLLFKIENDHKPSKAYIQALFNLADSTLSIRREIISLILHFSRNFDPFSTYLAINYMDRFLSTRTILDEKPWMLKLVAISCISLALKMRNSEFSFTGFQDDGGLILDLSTIERMEMLILAALKWRMRSINPFSFVKFFISFFDFEGQNSVKDRATEIIFKAQNDIKLLEFNSSIISASAVLYAVREMFPVQLSCFMNTICSCEYVNKENLLKCYNLMIKVGMANGYRSDLDDIVSSSLTPPNVLDLQYIISSSSTSQNNQTSLATKGLKRRRNFGDFTTNI